MWLFVLFCFAIVWYIFRILVTSTSRELNLIKTFRLTKSVGNHPLYGWVLRRYADAAVSYSIQLLLAALITVKISLVLACIGVSVATAVFIEISLNFHFNDTALI